MSNALVAFTKKGGLAVTEEKGRAIAAIGDKLGIKTKPSLGLGNGQFQNGSNEMLLAFDATGSTSHIWQQVHGDLNRLLERLRELHQSMTTSLLAYRDYCDGNLILEELPATDNPELLKRFLARIDCNGGGDDPEAVEVALERMLAKKPGIGVIVGDAPPHGVVDQIQNGKDYRTISRQLKQAGIPVYTVSTRQSSSTIKAFEEIAEITGGKHFPLSNINNLIDNISFAAAKGLGKVGDLADILRKQQGGRLNAAQEKILLLAG